MKISKRAAPAFAGLLALLGALLASACGAREQADRVFSDIDPLRSVIILSPDGDERKESYNLFADEPIMSLGYWEGMAGQHKALRGLLQSRGVRALDLEALLDDAIANARRAGRLEEALASIYPEEFPRLKSELGRITARAMLGRDPAFYFRYDGKGTLDPLIPTSGAFFFTRDFAVSTPRGVIITNGRPRWRRHEHRLGRFLFRYARQLAAFPIAFDAEAEGVRCDGGDIIVKDERTILMGIGNFSDREAAAAIARKLDMTVIGVAMPPIDGPSGANFVVMHLDTVFNIVDRRKALTVPYLFLKKYADANPLTRYLQAVQDRPRPGLVNGEFDMPVSLKTAIGAIPGVGWITEFEAGTGTARESGEKLGDYLAAQGYEIIPVGGEQGSLEEDRYIDDRVLYELGLQAANVVQLGPGKVVAYAHNRHTNDALRKRGIEVLAFDGKYLADMMGGPHCLTMPLARARRGD